MHLFDARRHALDGVDRIAALVPGVGGVERLDVASVVCRADA